MTFRKSKTFRLIRFNNGNYLVQVCIKGLWYRMKSVEDGGGVTLYIHNRNGNCNMKEAIREFLELFKTYQEKGAGFRVVANFPSIEDLEKELSL